MKLTLQAPTSPYKVTQGWNENPEFYKKYGVAGHNGLDIRAFNGENIYAAHDGEVVYAGEDGSSGLLVVLRTLYKFDYENAEGGQFYFKTLYAHIKKQGILVVAGQLVKKGQIIALADNCFDNQTEVLTNKGWKYFKDLAIDDDVATLNMKTREIEYQRPTQYVKRFKEKMHSFSNGKIDFLISGDHNLLLDRGWRLNKLKLEPIEKVKTGNPKLVTRGIWKGKETKYFKLPSVRIDKNQHSSKMLPEIKVDMDKWLSFLGIMISDGNVRKKGNRVSIAQSYSYPDRIKKIDELISNLPFHFKTRDRKQFEKYNALKNWEISDKRLATYLQKNVGSGNTKKSPDFIGSLSKRQIDIFLEYFFMGDGFYRERLFGGREKTYYPGTSKILADQLQEFILKSGKIARIVQRNFKSKNFEVKEYFSDASYFNPKEVEIVDYNDYAYCVSVPNKTLYVRRNGKAIFLGNTGLSSGSHLHLGCKPVYKGENDWQWENLEKNEYRGAIDPTPYLVPYKHTFSTPLKFGDKGQEVVELQRTLKEKGYFYEEPTGYYGKLTKEAVFKFQKDKCALSWYERTVLKGSLVGPKTITALNI